jgi:hypothetical protein
VDDVPFVGALEKGLHNVFYDAIEVINRVNKLSLKLIDLVGSSAKSYFLPLRGPPSFGNLSGSFSFAM